MDCQCTEYESGNHIAEYAQRQGMNHGRCIVGIVPTFRSCHALGITRAKTVWIVECPLGSVVTGDRRDFTTGNRAYAHSAQIPMTDECSQVSVNAAISSLANGMALSLIRALVRRCSIVSGYYECSRAAYEAMKS